MSFCLTSGHGLEHLSEKLNLAKKPLTVNL